MLIKWRKMKKCDLIGVLVLIQTVPSFYDVWVVRFSHFKEDGSVAWLCCDEIFTSLKEDVFTGVDEKAILENGFNVLKKRNLPYLEKAAKVA